jgi:hypothetical protein
MNQGVQLRPTVGHNPYKVNPLPKVNLYKVGKGNKLQTMVQSHWNDFSVLSMLKQLFVSTTYALICCTWWPNKPGPIN